MNQTMLRVLASVFVAVPMMLGAAAPQAPNTLTETERAGGWTLLFDGRTTDRWRGFNDTQFPASGWTVEDGTLHHIAGQAGGDIITVDQFEDFELQLDWRIAPGANGGIKYLVDESLVRVGRSGLGFEMQILDDERHPDAKMGKAGNRTAGALYDLIAPTNRTLHPVGEWNHVSIVVRRGHVEHWLNSGRIVQFDLGSPEMKGLIAGSKYRVNPGFGDARRGHILLQDHGDGVWFRNIKVRSFPPSSPSAPAR